MAELVKAGAFQLLPPPPWVCQECAVDHRPEEPHNQESLYYQVAFHAKHGRYPTWTDAMAHCSPEIQKVWREELIKRLKDLGREIPGDLWKEMLPGPGRE